MRHALVIATLAIPVLFSTQAGADELWQPPHKENCSVEPGQDCGADVACPSSLPYVVSGGGGIPKISDENHRLAMTMNVAINPGIWRVRWRNMGDKKVDATVMIRVQCTDDGDAWGK